MEVARDCASGRAVDLLEHLARTLDEAAFVLQFVKSEADLSLHELGDALANAYNEAWKAYNAAILLNERAVLAERWGKNPSRPAAVFARHKAALDAAGLGAQLFSVSPPYMVRRPKPWAGPRPFDDEPVRVPCGKPTLAGSPCRNLTAVLAGGVNASGCHHHLEESEQGPYLERSREIYARRVQIEAFEEAEIMTVAWEVARQWLQNADRTAEQHHLMSSLLMGSDDSAVD